MKPWDVSLQAWVTTALLTMSAPQLAKGDGGVVLSRQSQGPFSVTVFVSPETAAGSFADVSILVQWKKTGEVVLDADVSLTVEPPEGLAISQSDPICLPPAAAQYHLPQMSQHQATTPATRTQASNKLLYAATLNLSAPGDWPLRVYVSHGSDSAHFDCLLPVSRTTSNSSGLWPYLAFPPIVITAFAMNQWLRRQSLEKSL